MLKWPKIASSTNKEVNLIDVLNVRRLSDVPVHMSTVSSDTNRVLQFLHQYSQFTGEGLLNDCLYLIVSE